MFNIKKEENKIEKNNLANEDKKSSLVSLFKKNPVNPFVQNKYKDKKEILKEYSGELQTEKQARENNEITNVLESKSLSKEKKVESNIKKLSIGKIVFKQNKWKAPKILKTNLIKGESATYVEWKKYLLSFLSSLLFPLLTIVVLYGSLVFWEKKTGEEGELLAQENEMSWKQVNKKEEEIKVADFLQTKIDLVNGLLVGHVYWTEFFNFLEDNTLPSVFYLGGFSGATDGMYSFSCQAKSFYDIYKQVKVFRSLDEVQLVEVSGISFVSEAIKDDNNKVDLKEFVEFNLKIMLNQDVFKK